MCVHTLTPRENRERQSPKHLKNFEKNTIFNEHPVSQNKNCIFISDHSFHGYDEFTLQKKYFICNAYYQSRFVWQCGKIENYHYIGNQFWDKIFLFCILRIFCEISSFFSLLLLPPWQFRPNFHKFSYQLSERDKLSRKVKMTGRF